MFTAFYTSAEMVAFTLTSLAMLSFAAAIISFLGLSWSNESWRIPGALVGTACMITAVYYAGAAGLWYGRRRQAQDHVIRHGIVFILYRWRQFFLCEHSRKGTCRSVLACHFSFGPNGFGRWLGDATFFNPTLGALFLSHSGCIFLVKCISVQCRKL